MWILDKALRAKRFASSSTKREVSKAKKDRLPNRQRKEPGSKEYAAKNGKVAGGDPKGKVVHIVDAERVS
jgi:hypothetical protein